MKTIVVEVEGSETAGEALRLAAAEAENPTGATTDRRRIAGARRRLCSPDGAVPGDQTQPPQRTPPCRSARAPRRVVGLAGDAGRRDRALAGKRSGRGGQRSRLPRASRALRRRGTVRAPGRDGGAPCCPLCRAAQRTRRGGRRCRSDSQSASPRLSRTALGPRFLASALTAGERAAESRYKRLGDAGGN